MNRYELQKGKHDNPDDGDCAMEWVSRLAGEPRSDHPQCVDPVLAVLFIGLNDLLGHEYRQKLRPYLARTIGTRGDGLTLRRNTQLAVAAATYGQVPNDRAYVNVKAIICCLLEVVDGRAQWDHDHRDAQAWPEIAHLLEALLPTEIVELPPAQAAELEQLVTA